MKFIYKSVLSKLAGNAKNIKNLSFFRPHSLQMMSLDPNTCQAQVAVCRLLFWSMYKSKQCANLSKSQKKIKEPL